ncbi:hypothetical protein [Dongia sp.]|uniref:hypothetical protein n=1 Tax=Dongia sp. TaxID=1977262 RepID=UPI0035B3CF93
MSQTEMNDPKIDEASQIGGMADAMMPVDALTLNLSDLLPDANGEIVILNEGDDPSLNIVTDLRLLESGIAESHVTDGGIDVKGLQYWVFEDGTKLYYSPGLSISVDHVIA